MGVKVRWNDKAKQFYIYVCHKKRRKAYPAGVNLRKANTLADEKRDYLRRTNLDLPAASVTAPLLSAYLTDWLASLTTRCKQSTIDSYRREVVRHIIPALGARPVDSITRADCLSLVQRWALTGLRTQSLKLILATLSAAMTDATAYLPVNPVDKKLRAECKQPDEVDFEALHYTTEETVDLLNAAKVAPEPFAYTLLLMAVRTGVRLGELIAVKWTDIDMPEATLTVQRSRNRTGVVTGPKRGKRRYVDLSNEVLAHLATLPKDQPLWPPYEQDQVRRLFHRVRKVAKLRPIRVHDLRHTYASQLLKAGVPIHYVSKQLGHSTIDMTVSKYGHLVKGANREWVNRLTPTQ